MGPFSVGQSSHHQYPLFYAVEMVTKGERLAGQPLRWATLELPCCCPAILSLERCRPFKSRP